MAEVLITSSVLIIVLALLRLAGNRVSARLRYALWALVLVRLLLPAGLLPSSVSVMNAAPALERPAITAGDNTNPAPAPVDPPPGVSAPAVVPPAGGDAFIAPPESPDAPAKGPASPAAPTGPSLSAVLRWIWLGGACAAGVYFLLSNLLFYRKLRRRAERRWELDGPLPIYEADFLASPCMAGLFRPAIYLNTAALESGEGLRHVLAHELCHKKHGDNWWALLRCVVLAIWWFDPLVWLAAALSRRDCELACDEAALKLLGEEERIPYGMTLVALTARANPADLLRCTTAMTAGKRALKERVACIARSRKTGTATALAGLLAVVLAACTLTGEKAAPGPTPDPEPLPTAEDSALAQPDAARKDGFYTFLLVGQDTHGGGNTDTMLLAAYDIPNQKLSFMSLPRDTLVNVPWDIKKLNSVYNVYGGGDEGMAALKETVAKLVGFTPDFTVTVQWEAVGELVEAIGGVDFDVPRNMYYNDLSQNFKIDLKKGPQTLNGAQAMQLLRYRHDSDDEGNILNSGYPDGDLGRIKVQQDFLKAALTQCLERITDAGTVVKLAQVFFDNVTTDLTVGNLVWLGKAALFGEGTGTRLTVDGVSFCTMPWVSADGVWSRTYNNRPSYVAPDAEKLVEALNSGFNPYRYRELSGYGMEIMSVQENGALACTTMEVADTEYNDWILGRQTPDPDAKTALLQFVEEMFNQSETVDMWYFADPGSGPSSAHGFGKEALPELQEIISRYEWRRTETTDWRNSSGENPPEGYAGSVRIFNSTGGRGQTLDMLYGRPFLEIRYWTGQGAGYYWTADYRQFYRDLETFWYKYSETWIRAWVVSLATDLWQTGTVTARLERPDGSVTEKDVSAKELGEKVEQLLNGRDHWMWLPAGPADVEAADLQNSPRLILTAGEESTDIVICETGSYLRGPGYTWRSISDSGTDKLFSELCAVLGIGE